MHSARPLYAIAISLLAVVLIVISRRHPNLRESWTILASIIKFAVIASMIPAILNGKIIEYTLITILPGLDIKFRVDALGILFASTASFLWILTSIYSIGYMRKLKEHAQTRYFSYFAASMAATIGVAFSANMFTLFFFYEAITLCTFPLVAHKETPEAIKGARTYIVYLLGASVAFQLSAIFLTYYAAGTLDFTTHGILTGKGSDILLTVIFILFMAGIAKAAIMPFHNWLPAAMVAPTPVSALLHAVAVVKTGVFTILRVIFFIFGVDLIHNLNLSTAGAYFVSITIIVASLIALTKDNLKARLAYSTISQLSYIILGAFLMTPSSMVGGIVHIANHAFSKITLFFCAGSIYCAAHKTEVSQLSGLGRKMPWTMAAFFIASLSMIGVPPAAGFISKWYLAMGSIEAKEVPILIVLLVSTILNAAYFLPISYKAFFEEPNEGRDVDGHNILLHENHSEGHSSAHDRHGHEIEFKKIKEIPLVAIPLVLTAIISIVIGIYPDYFLTLAKEIIR